MRDREAGKVKNLQGFHLLLFLYVTWIFYPKIMFVYNLKSSATRGEKKEKEKKKQFHSIIQEGSFPDTVHISQYLIIFET